MPGGQTINRPPGWINPWYGPQIGETIHHPGTVPKVQPGIIPQQPGYIPHPQGVVIPQVQSNCGGCCCCNCGGGSGTQGYHPQGMTIPFSSQGYVQHMQQTSGYANGMLPQQALPYLHAPIHMGVDTNQYIQPVHPVPSEPIQTDTVLKSNVPEQVVAPIETCPWECVIDETVGTWGHSNTDDALYEIFYTNPLNCCGTIVEIGAGEGLNVDQGIDFSTSRFFEEGMNWTAIMTEANPIQYEALADHRKGLKARAIPGAFCYEGPFLYFDETTKQFESIAEGDETSELMVDFAVESTTPKVSCIRLDSILSGIDHVNIMVIRVPGNPWAVMRTMDWDIKVDIWLIDMSHTEAAKTIRAALKLHDYVQAAWDIKLWCDQPTDCVDNEVWLRKGFNPMPRPLLTVQENRHLLRGGIDNR